MLAVTATSHQNKKVAGAISDDLFANWLPILNTFRTFCSAPIPEDKQIFNILEKLTITV
jgi:hypothetical protein